MKKTISIFLLISLMLGVCCFSVNASDSTGLEQVNEKVFEYRNSFTKSQDKDVIRTTVFFNVTTLTVEEKEQIIFERCGLTKSDIQATNYNMTSEERAEWNRKKQLYRQTETQINNEIIEQNCKPFFEYMDLGVEFKFDGSFNKYHGQDVVMSETEIYIYFSKSEITKAYQSDYVNKIYCIEKLNNEAPTNPPVGTYSEKIDYFDDETCYFANVSDNDLILAKIFFSGDKVDLEAALDQAYIQCGYEPGSSFGYDLENYNSWSNEDKANYDNLINLIWKARGDIVNEQTRAIMLPKVQTFFDLMGIEPVTDNERIKYREKYIKVLSNCAIVCLSKAEVIQASELDCIEKITVENPENDYYVNHGEYPEGYLPDPSEITTLLQQKLGDVNGDNVLNIFDAVDIQKNSVDKISFTNAQKKTGDYNKDGNCDMLDALEIQKVIVAD